MPVIDKISLRGTTYDINDTGARVNKVDNSVIAPVETGSTASHAYAEGDYFIKDSAFCTAIDDISIGDTLTENTNYTTGQLVDALGGDLSNYIQKSVTEGLIKNDGTIDTSRHVHLQPTGTELTGEVQAKTLSGLTSFYGEYILTDGDNIYYSNGSNQYVLDKSTSTWNTKTWSGLTNFDSDECILTDGDNIYYSKGSNQYVLDKATSTLNTKTWSGLPSFDGDKIWTDKDNIYYSDGRDHYILDKSTSTLNTKAWTGLPSFDGRLILTDGDNIYNSYSSYQYVLDKSTSTWSTKTWNGLTSIYGYYIWSDKDNIYYSAGSSAQYILDKSTSTWSSKSWTGLTSFNGANIWTDGENIYYSSGSSQYVFISETFYPDGLVKSDGSIIIPDNSTITISNGVISAAGGGGVATSVIGTEENGSTASKSYSTGEYFIKDDAFCKAITDISSGAPFSEGSNYDETNIASILKNAGSEIKVVFDQTPSSSSSVKCINFLANLYNTYMKQDFPENQDVIDLIKRALSKKYRILFQSPGGGAYIFLQFTDANVNNDINALTFTSIYNTNYSLSFSSNTISCNAYINGTNRSTASAATYMNRIILIENC